MQTTIGWLLGSFLITVLVVRGAIGYAHRRGMLDRPGRRRSHVTATPRGGGIGVVVAMLVCLPGVLWQGYSTDLVASLLAAMVLVAGAGWWDDHRSLPVLPRLGAQLLAVTLFSVALLGVDLTWWWLPPLVLAGAWSINLHNFMDGIDGLLALQVIFVTAGMAVLALTAGLPILSAAAAILCAAVLGFWCYNRSPARIFMGDVGSGTLGFLVFGLTALLWQAEHALIWPALILSSSFVIDATLTLLVRVLRGRRWYTAHREHLYQWGVRRGLSHAWVSRGYLSWNLLFVLPLSWFAWSHLRLALPITIGSYLGAAVVWLLLKRHCLRNPLRKASHAAS
ncbi:MAG: glycosyltransferase family 4 protein [Pseudomonadota bacterium]|nr:glycosyltransferase family 4 protein [Pseudomonadota bacterium]